MASIEFFNQAGRIEKGAVGAFFVSLLWSQDGAIALL